MNRIFKSVLVVLLLVIPIAGCKKSPSADDFWKLCQKMEAEGEINLAIRTCESAVKADPTSDAGKAALVKLKDLRSKQADEKKADAKADAEARAAAAVAARTKVSRKRWDVMDDSCTSQGKPPKGYRYSGGTTNENESVARADGCVPQPPSYVDFYFCCSK